MHRVSRDGATVSGTPAHCFPLGAFKSGGTVAFTGQGWKHPVDLGRRRRIVPPAGFSHRCDRSAMATPKSPVNSGKSRNSAVLDLPSKTRMSCTIRLGDPDRETADPGVPLVGAEPGGATCMVTAGAGSPVEQGPQPIGTISGGRGANPFPFEQGLPDDGIESVCLGDGGRQGHGKDEYA